MGRSDAQGAVPADNPSGPAGAVRTMAFRLGDQSYRAIQAGPLAPFNQSFSIVVIACLRPPCYEGSALWVELRGLLTGGYTGNRYLATYCPKGRP